MVTYNPKEWFSVILHFHKSDTVRKLSPTILILVLFTLAVVLTDKYLLKIGPDSIVAKTSVMYSLLGFVISLLLVFRTNTAYERWWEGRKAWGSLMNSTRNLAMKAKNVLTDYPLELLQIKGLIIHYPYALKNHLRNISTMNEVELMELFSVAELKDKKHIPLQICDQLFSIIFKLRKDGKINGEELLIINLEVQLMIEVCGACERIKNTPIPFSYSVFLKKFIFIYIITLPLIYAPVLSYYSIPIVALIFYVLASLELIAEEIENPFGTDANDLPLDEISKAMRQSVELLIK